jgi:hypothetical protein
LNEPLTRRGGTTTEASDTTPAATSSALGVLAGVLDNDGGQLPATQARQQALSDADHLAVLHTIWTAETAPARHQRYRDLYLAALPPGYQHEPGHQATWLWRTLHAAELAGLDPAEALATAIGERDLTGARDIPSVFDARLRRRTGQLTPLPAPLGLNDFRSSPTPNAYSESDLEVFLGLPAVSGWVRLRSARWVKVCGAWPRSVVLAA